MSLPDDINEGLQEPLLWPVGEVGNSSVPPQSKIAALQIDWSSVKRAYLAHTPLQEIIARFSHQGLNSPLLQAQRVKEGWGTRRNRNIVVGTAVQSSSQPVVTLADVARALSRQQVYNATRYYSWAERNALLYDRLNTKHPAVAVAALFQNLDAAVIRPTHGSKTHLLRLTVVGMPVIDKVAARQVVLHLQAIRTAEMAALLGGESTFPINGWKAEKAEKEWLLRAKAVPIGHGNRK